MSNENATTKKEYDFTIRSDNRNADLRFNGDKIATNWNRWVNGRDDTRWTEWDLYSTESGKFVYVESDVSLWQGESNFVRAEVFVSLNEFREYFLSSRDTLSSFEKEFLSGAGIELVEEI